MTRTLLALTLSLATLTPALALAQDPGTRTEVFDDADQVTGTLQSPDGERWMAHLRGRRHTLIQPRAHYNPEMLRSVENL